MRPPTLSVLKVLKRKLSRIGDLDEKILGTPEQIICSNSCQDDSYKRLPKNISAVVTSPPYYGMSTYIQDQWLRMWFLGGPDTVDYSKKEQISHSGQDAFIKDLAKVWTNVHNSKADDVHLYVRFGSIPSTNKDARTILTASLEEATGWKIVSIRNALDAHAGKRQADQMTSGSAAENEFDFHVIRD